MPATYEPIATATLSSVATNITFSSIPSSYTDLVISFTGYAAAVSYQLSLQFNTDTATGSTNYSSTYLEGNGSAVASGRETNLFCMVIQGPQTLSTTIPTSANIIIPSYAGSTNKTVLATYSGDQNGSGTVSRTVGLWRQTSAINAIKIMSSNGAQNLAVGTTATLYGIKAE